MRRVGDFGSTMGKTFSEIAKLLQAPDLTSTDWKIELAAQIVMLQEAHQELLDLEDIPADMADIHVVVIDATGDCDQSTRLLTRGVDTISAADLRQANRLMGQCVEKIQAVTKLFKEYKAKHQE
jgi:hypothetical protein